MDQAFWDKAQQHALSRPKALLQLMEQYNANPWPLSRSKRPMNLFTTWPEFKAPVDVADTFAAHCAQAGISVGEGLRQLVQRLLQ